MVADAIKKATSMRKVLRPTPTSVARRPGSIALRRIEETWSLELPESRAWKVTVRTSQGRLVSTANLDGSRLTLDLGGIESGIYSVSAEGGGKTFHSKLIHSSH